MGYDGRNANSSLTKFDSYEYPNMHYWKFSYLLDWKGGIWDIQPREHLTLYFFVNFKHKVNKRADDKYEKIWKSSNLQRKLDIKQGNLPRIGWKLCWKIQSTTQNLHIRTRYQKPFKMLHIFLPHNLSTMDCRKPFMIDPAYSTMDYGMQEIHFKFPKLLCKMPFESMKNYVPAFQCNLFWTLNFANTKIILDKAMIWR